MLDDCGSGVLSLNYKRFVVAWHRIHVSKRKIKFLWKNQYSLV